MTAEQALRLSSHMLRTVSDSPRLDAEVLLSFVSGYSRTHLLTHPEITLPTTTYRRYRRLIARRGRHVPIPYLTGRCEFFGLPMTITPAVLVPRPFTELLIEAVLTRVEPTTRQTFVDIGTGSGAVALALASKLPRASIIGTDISPAALAVAKRNARSLGLTRRLHWYRGSLLSALPPSVRPDILITNLPYLTKRQLREPSIRREPRLALDGGGRGVQLIRRLLVQAADFPTLSMIALECDPNQVTTIVLLLKTWSRRSRIIRIHDGRKVRGLIAVQ